VYKYKQVKNDVKVYALSQKGAVPSGNVYARSHRGAQYNLSYKKEPRREICWALFISKRGEVINYFISYGQAGSRILKR
jgi:hypothetical protein